jgi:hypothetical protein
MLARSSRRARSLQVDPWPAVTWSVAESGYVRPPIVPPVILDDTGQVIPYGTRWAPAPPPADTYEVVTHPERFTPLLTVAEALVTHLERTYDVETAPRAQEREYKAGLPTTGPFTGHAVTITPRRRDCTPLTIEFTDFPSVRVKAGMFFYRAFPDCGCDACDDEWSYPATVLEGVVLAVAKGTFTETIRARQVTTCLRAPDGGSGWTEKLSESPYSPAYIAQARRTLESLPAGWQPWPERVAKD